MPEQDVYAEFADPVGPSATAVADPPDPYAEFADPVAPAAPAGATEADPYAAFADPVTPSATPRGQPDPYAEFADPVQPEKPYSLGADVSAAPGEAGRGFARGGASVSAGLGGLLEAAGRAGSRFESNVARELQMRWFYPGGKWNPVLSAFGMKEPEPGAEGDTLRQGGTAVTRGYKAVGEAGQKWAEKMETIQAGPELAPRPEGPYSKVAGIVWQAAPIVTGLIATRNPTLGASLYAAVVGGEGFHRAKAAGLDDTEALGAGILHGAGAYAGGRVNLENIFLKDTAVRDAVARFGFNKVAGWGVQYAKAAGANVAVNEAQQVYDNAVRMGYDGNAKAFDGLMDAAIMGLLFSAQHAPGSAARAFREANVKTVRANLEKAFGAENVKPYGETGFEVANGERRTIVEFVKHEAELGPRDVEGLATSAREKYPKLWEKSLAESGGDEAAAKVKVADLMTPPAQTRANVTIRDPATGALVDVDGLIQLVAGRATVGQTRHELLHDLARLSGARKEGDLLVDPVSGESLREEALAEALEKGIDHPITRRVKDAALGIVNLFRTEKQESPFQTARRLMRGMQEEAKLSGEAAEPKALSAEESAETAAAAEAAAKAFDARAVEPGGGPGGIPLLEGPPKRVTGLVDQFGRTIAGTENLPVRAAVEPRNAPAQGQGASQAEKPITAVSAQRPPPSIARPGASWAAETPGKEAKVGGSWKVVEAASLLTSDKAGYDKALQPRNRSTVASQEQVASIASEPDPGRLADSPTTDTGAPLVDQNGQVVSGNGRVMGLRQAYAGGRAGRYQAAVLARAKELGLPEAGLMKEPVLVRELSDSGGKTVTDIAELSNRSQVMARSAAEQAEADGKMLVESGAIDLFKPDAVGTIRTSSNTEFLRAFVQGTGDAGLRGAKGGFAPDIDGRVRRAVLAAILGEHEQGRQIVQDAIERADELGIRRQLDGVMAAGPELVKLAKGKPAYDLRPALAQAVRDLVEFKKQVASGKMKTLEDYLGQGEMFDTGRTPASEAILRALDESGTIKGTREWLDRYTALAAKIDVTTGDMFGTRAATREELLGKALKTKIETQKPFMPLPSGEAQAPAAARKTAAPTPEGAEAHKAPITKAGAVFADWPKDFGGANPSDDAMRFGIEHQAPEHLAEMERRYQASLARGDPLIAEAEAALARGDRAEATRITEAMERVPQLAQFWREARWAANQALTGKTESDILSLRTGEQYADRTGNPPEDRPGAATTRGRPGLAGTVPEGTAGPGRPVPAQVPGQGGKPLPREPLGAPLHKGLTPPPATVREAAAAMSLPAEEPRPGQPITEAAPPLSLHQREARSAKDIRRTYFIESVLNPDGQREYFAGDAEGNETPRFFSAEKAAAYYEREQRLKQIEFLRGQLSRTWFQRSRLPVDEIFPEYDPAIIREAARENAANEPIRYAVEAKGPEEGDILSESEYRATLRANYVDKEGKVLASSREAPAIPMGLRLGMWRRDDMPLNHGRELAQLRLVDPNTLNLAEDLVETNQQGRGWDADRYAQWFREGKAPPPVEIVETDKGTLKVTDGHRRVAAAKRNGQPVLAWVSPAMDHPDPNYAGVKTGLTYEAWKNGTAKRTGPLTGGFSDTSMQYPEGFPRYAVEAKAGEEERFSFQRAGPRNFGKWTIPYVDMGTKAEMATLADRLNRSGLSEREVYDAARAGRSTLESLLSERTRYAVEKKAGEEEAGAAKPRFANPMVTTEARRWAAAQRTAREAAGLPPHTTDAEIRAKADAILADKPGTWSALRRGELNMVDDAAKMQAAKRLLDEKVSAAIQAGDASGLAEAVEAYGRYEEAGSRMGAAFRERRDWTLTPEDHNRQALTDALLKPPEAVKTELAKAKTPAERTAISEREAVRIAGTARAVEQRTGLNPARLSKATLRDSATVAELIREINARSARGGDKAFEYWRSAILSGPGTQVGNITGNTAAFVWDRTIQKTGEALLNLVLRKPEATQLGELGPMWRATFGSMGKAGRQALLAFSTELPVMEGMKVEESGPAIVGTKGRVIRLPQRLLLAADEYSKTVIYDGTIAALAYRTAKAEGLRGEDLGARQEELRTNPTDEMMTAAMAEAKRLTFQEKLGAIAGGILQMRKNVPGLRYVAPFVTTPANIVKIGIKKTPLGTAALLWKAARGEYRGEGAALTRDVAEQIIAWAAFAGVGAMIDDEDGEPRVTGNRPPSNLPAGQRALQQKHYPPQSIRLGGRWFSYARIEPLATSLSLMVDSWDLIRNPGGRSVEEQLWKAWNSVAGQVRDKTFLQGLGDILHAIEDSGREGAVRNWLTNFAASWVPNIGRTTMRATDTEIRDMRLRKQDQETLGSKLGQVGRQALQKALPLPALAPSPRRDWLGQPIQKTERLGPATDVVWRILSGMKIQEVPDPEALTTALDRFVWNYNQKAEKNGWTDQWWPGAARNEMTLPGYPGTDRKRYMTDDEFERFQILRGELFLAAAGRYHWDPVDPKQTHMRHLKHLYELATDRARREAIEARTRR